MIKNLNDVLVILAAAIEADATISAYCAAEFGKPLSILVGIDPKNPPKFDATAPMVLLSSGTRYREQLQAYLVHQLRVGIAMECDDPPAKVGNITTYPGLAKLDALSVLVERCVTVALNGAGFAAVQAPEHEDITNHPMYEAVWTYDQISIPNRI